MGKQFLAFIGSWYYPQGGWKDFCGFFDTIEEAKKYIEDVIGDDKNMWGNIADIENKTVIEFSSRDKIWENTDFYNDVEKV